MNAPERVTGVAILCNDSEGMKCRRDALTTFLKKVRSKGTQNAVIVAPSVKHVWMELLRPLMAYDRTSVTGSVMSSEFKVYGVPLSINAPDSSAMFSYKVESKALMFGHALLRRGDSTIRVGAEDITPYDYRLFDCESLKSSEEGIFLMELSDARSKAPRAALSRLEGMGNPKGVREMHSLPKHDDSPPNLEEWLMITSKLSALGAL